MKKKDKPEDPKVPKLFKINWNNVLYSENLSATVTRVHFGPNSYLDIVKPLNDIVYDIKK